MEEAKNKRVHTVLFHLYKILENLIYSDKQIIIYLRIERCAKRDYKGARGNFRMCCTL